MSNNNSNSALVLFMCAGLLLSAGAILGGSTTWSLLRMSYYFYTTDLNVELASSVTFIAAALLCMPASWLATLVPYHPRSQPLFATLLCVAMTAMVMLSVGQCSLAGLPRALRDPSGLNASMHRAMSRERVDPAVRASFAAMQLELRCCGVKQASDWYRYRSSLPPSCCGRLRNSKHETCQTIYNRDSPTFDGCLPLAVAELRSYASALSALSSAIIIVLAVTVFAAAYTLVSGVVARHKPAVRVAYLAPNIPMSTSFASFAPGAPALAPPAPITASP